MKIISLLLFIVLGSGFSAQAKGFKHLIEGGFELSSLRFSPDNGSSYNDSSFTLKVNYWHKHSSKIYLVGNFEFTDSDRGDGHLFAGGAAYNMAKDLGGDFEIGPGFRFGLASFADNDGILFGPNLFIRNFFDGTRAFITFQLGYEFAFLDNVDFRGFISTVALGVAF